ncbi:ChrR family anti-sigma-E factor [Phenylobacterium sp.]|uniref:ChrR family anti-sigma-E factor n=1 Tax=Phenylobacterium sp. TaxID=1871053 RepID=UPI00398343DC
MKHHPSKVLLARHAAGALPFGPSATILCHLQACAPCAATVQGFEQSEGQLLESLPNAPIPPGALDRILARLDEPAAPTAAAKPPWLRDLPLPDDVADAGFASQRWLRPGVWVAHLDGPRTDGWRTYLLHAGAGTRFPEHGHVGAEMVVVLQGAINDGQSYVAGDFAENSESVRHALKVSPDEACVCLVSTHGRLAWRGGNRVIGLVLDI